MAALAPPRRAPVPTGAGDFTRRIAFQQRAADDNGDPLGEWTTVVTRDARIAPLKGGETVIGQRLQGDQPAILIVRRDSVTKAIDDSWRALDARDAAIVWGIESVIWNEPENLMEFLAVQRRGGSDA